MASRAKPPGCPRACSEARTGAGGLGGGCARGDAGGDVVSACAGGCGVGDGGGGAASGDGPTDGGAAGSWLYPATFGGGVHAPSSRQRTKDGRAARKLTSGYRPFGRLSTAACGPRRSQAIRSLATMTAVAHEELDDEAAARAREE